MAKAPRKGRRVIPVVLDGRAVLVEGDGAPVDAVETIFAHCGITAEMAAPASPIAVLSVRPDSRRSWTLWKDDSEVAIGLSAADTIERLVYEVTVTLARACASAMVLHAAGVTRGENGVILCGEPGRGKSTLAAALTIGGYGFVSDELIVVSEDGAVMRGLPRAIAIKDDSPFRANRYAARIQADCPTVAPTAICYLDPNRLRPGAVCESATTRVLLFPAYSGTETPGLRPITPAAAVYRLLHHVVNGDSLVDHGFAGAAALARRARALSITYADVFEAVEAINRICEDGVETDPRGAVAISAGARQ